MTKLNLLVSAIFAGTCAASNFLTHTNTKTGRKSQVPYHEYSSPSPMNGMNRPELIDYNPVADPKAVVVSSDGQARFTVLTDRIIRMERLGNGSSVFEDRSTIAIMNRNLPVPVFTQNTVGNVLTIQTAKVKLTYTLGAPTFTSNTLNVISVDPTSAFTSWSFGQPFPGNLLGTIRGLDGQDQTPLNCTTNSGIDDNGEYNHCEWGMVSRDGWVVYDDTINFALDANDWWSTDSGTPRQCLAQQAGTDVVNPTNSMNFPSGTTVASPEDCCNACLSDPTCRSGYVFDTSAGDSPNCWPLSGHTGIKSAQNRIFSNMKSPQGNADGMDLYGFFHGHDYFGALNEFVQISGRAVLTPRYTSGIWWSRWYDIGNFDTRKIVDDYRSRSIPLDTFVIDMDWHKKNDWSGFTFDQHLFPNPADSMKMLKAYGLGITLNIHDASGINIWEDRFVDLITNLGLPANSTVVPMNLVNATVAYAVEDIVIGDLIYNQSVDFMWIDWQQGNFNGGVAGGKQNPTIWLNHLRCTDRHRIGDTNRGLVLARWGGLGGHRYQVGFSGDVNGLTWANMAYQPYFSATAANVGHPFWSHDIEGPPSDEELYTRWIQIGAFSGVMRSHDRGMSAGGCANDKSGFSCSIVEPWNVPQAPGVFNMEANRLALRMREELVPYIYNGHRSAFETGVGIIIPMYYFFPELDDAYLMDAAANNVQYMFGPSILFSPVVTQADATGLASKSTWLPPGTWYDVQSGSLTTVTTNSYYVTKGYTLTEIPQFYVAGAVIPFVPLESLEIIGLASKQYTFLGFKVVPGGTSGSVQVYEDDGVSTAYLTNNAYAKTSASYTSTASSLAFTISTNGSYPELPNSRAYRIQLLNGVPLSSVTVNGVNVPYNRYGEIAAKGKVPATHQWFYDFNVVQGLSAVIDLVGMSTASPVNVAITYDPSAPSAAAMSGVFGATYHAVLAKGNTDLDRSTPGSNDPTPAALSQLSSVGDLLCYQAGADPQGFAATIASIPGMFANATAETAANKSPRAVYASALLKFAMV